MNAWMTLDYFKEARLRMAGRSGTAWPIGRQHAAGLPHSSKPAREDSGASGPLPSTILLAGGDGRPQAGRFRSSAGG